MRRVLEKAIRRLAATTFVKTAIEERANLDAFREKPTPTILAGVLIIIISSLLGWPAVVALGVLSVKLETPWIGVVGAPLVYGFSHLLFLLGMYLSGMVYSMIFCRWLARVTIERLLAWLEAKNSAKPLGKAS
ncbi:MAG: hypothetical protein ACK5PS_01520 [Desulfopila sp.]